MVDHDQGVRQTPLDQRLVERIGRTVRQSFEIVDRVVADHAGQQMAPRVRVVRQRRSERQSAEQVERRRLPEPIPFIPHRPPADRDPSPAALDPDAGDLPEPRQSGIAVRRERLERDGLAVGPEPEGGPDPDQAALTGATRPVGRLEQERVGPAAGEAAVERQWVGRAGEAADERSHCAESAGWRHHSDRPAACANGPRSRIRAAN